MSETEDDITQLRRALGSDWLAKAIAAHALVEQSRLRVDSAKLAEVQRIVDEGDCAWPLAPCHDGNPCVWCRIDAVLREEPK